MKHTHAFVTLLLLTPPATLHAADTSRSGDKPNFIVINIDDLGYADIGPFGSTLNRTPHLDRMAQEGRRLTCFYAAPVCSPSRAALMTGCYPKRVLPIPGVLFPAGAVGLNPEERTVAEVLKDAGYATACIGKWHLGDQPEFLPTRAGLRLLPRHSLLERHGHGRRRLEERPGRSAAARPKPAAKARPRQTTTRPACGATASRRCRWWKTTRSSPG